MPPHRHFFDHEAIEREIFHDMKWPRILVKTTGEILSVAMAKRIMYHLNRGSTFEEVPPKFREEWNREIDAETVEALFNREIETTDQPVPSGEHLVCPQMPAIADPEFVTGTVIPSGIYYEIVNFRERDPAFLQDYVAVRWGLNIRLAVVEELIVEWVNSLHVDDNGVPIMPRRDARPPHPGRRMADLTTEPNDGQDRRSSFSIPPPLYSPRPTWRNLTLRHPREVNDDNGHLPPYFPSDERPQAPGYSPGEVPPRYEESQEAASPSVMTSPNTVPTQSRVEATALNGVGAHGLSPSHATQATQPPVAALPERKNPGWPICPAVLSRKYTIDDIIVYLFSKFKNGRVIYVRGPFEPEIPDLDDLKEATQELLAHLHQAEINRDFVRAVKSLMRTYVDVQHPVTFQQLEDLGAEPMKRFFTELQHGMSDTVLYGENLSVRTNALRLINHIRGCRELPQVTVHEDTSSLTADLLEILRDQNDHDIMAAMRQSEHNSLWNYVRLARFMEELPMLNRSKVPTPPAEEQGFNHSPATPMPGPNPSMVPRLDDAPAEAHAGPHLCRLRRHRRIFRRLDAWHTMLSGFFDMIEAPPSIREEEIAISGTIYQYEAEIEEWQRGRLPEPRFWSLGYEIEQRLRELEVSIFVKITEIGPDDRLLWRDGYQAWLEYYYADFNDLVQEFRNEFRWLSQSITRIRRMPLVAPGRQPRSRDDIMLYFHRATRDLNDWCQARNWPHNVSNLVSLARNCRMPPVELIDICYKIRMTLLDLDSYAVVPGNQEAYEHHTGERWHPFADPSHDPIIETRPGHPPAPTDPSTEPYGGYPDDDTDEPPFRSPGLSERHLLILLEALTGAAVAIAPLQEDSDPDAQNDDPSDEEGPGWDRYGEEEDDDDNDHGHDSDEDSDGDDGGDGGNSTAERQHSGGSQAEAYADDDVPMSPEPSRASQRLLPPPTGITSNISVQLPLRHRYSLPSSAQILTGPQLLLTLPGPTSQPVESYTGNDAAILASFAAPSDQHVSATSTAQNQTIVGALGLQYIRSVPSVLSNGEHSPPQLRLLPLPPSNSPGTPIGGMASRRTSSTRGHPYDPHPNRPIRTTAPIHRGPGPVRHQGLRLGLGSRHSGVFQATAQSSIDTMTPMEISDFDQVDAAVEDVGSPTNPAVPEQEPTNDMDWE